LADTLNALELDELGRQVYNEFTLLAESDLLYQANGIASFNDLVNIIDINTATLELFEVNSEEEFFEAQKRQATQGLSKMEFESMRALAEARLRRWRATGG